MRLTWIPLVFLLAFVACEQSHSSVLLDGDILFHTSTSTQSEAIQRATGSPYSHVGVLFHEEGRAYVFEAHSSVKRTPLSEWIARGRGGHYVVKRLRNRARDLTPDALAAMRAVGREFAGRDYDWTFAWDDDRLYCSELVWKIYERGAGIEVGSVQTLGRFDLSHPTVAAKLRERYGDGVPLDEPVVSPAAIFDSEVLLEVERE